MYTYVGLRHVSYIYPIIIYICIRILRMYDNIEHVCCDLIIFSMSYIITTEKIYKAFVVFHLQIPAPSRINTHNFILEKPMETKETVTKLYYSYIILWFSYITLLYIIIRMSITAWYCHVDAICDGSKVSPIYSKYARWYKMEFIYVSDYYNFIVIHPPLLVNSDQQVRADIWVIRDTTV